MIKEEYIGTIELNGTVVNVGIDDYGQQYFFEFINKNGEKETLGCGAFNINFLDDIIYIVDRKGFFLLKYYYYELYKQLVFTVEKELLLFKKHISI